jgi:hypothetical protein
VVVTPFGGSSSATATNSNSTWDLFLGTKGYVAPEIWDTMNGADDDPVGPHSEGSDMCH